MWLHTAPSAMMTKNMVSTCISDDVDGLTDEGCERGGSAED